jgi:hypothetical protein
MKIDLRNIVAFGTASLVSWIILVSSILLQLSVIGRLDSLHLKIVLAFWSVWPFLTPFFYLLAFRFPIGEAKWKAALSAHILGALVAITIANYLQGELTQRIDFQNRVESEKLDGGISREKAIRRYHLQNLIEAFGLIGSCHAAYFYQLTRDQKRKSFVLQSLIKEIQLKQLTSQLKPHFLFNSLNSVASLIHIDPDAADAMLIALSRFLRQTLELPHSGLVNLKSELEMTPRSPSASATHELGKSHAVR